MTQISVCGWDIGGAHLKLVSVDATGRVLNARQIACPLWRGTEHLRRAMLDALSTNLTPSTQHVITMTGELCDNFESRTEGVGEILAVVTQVLDPNKTRVYAGGLGWRTIEQALTLGAEQIGSANWRATAETVASSYENALLIDVGSTTTDLVPILSGAPEVLGIDDASRLSNNELIYSGVVRTPVMALSQFVPMAGVWQRVAAEHFANTADIYRILGELRECADLHETADGGPKTIAASARRLCRVLGRDLSEDANSIRSLANYFAYRQFDLLQRAVLSLQSRPGPNYETIVAAGVGAFVAHKLARFNEISCVDYASLFDVQPKLETAVMTCAPAAALTKLWRTRG
ncbi:MAG TPA: S-layer protein [Gammaproteobacteria bacterium]|nr:S-layer protein [Gammaproteobacteria bacterium]|tara:strand:+ start:1037 stop:2077 length:1041 start_codon:yes stop_codon:yes gene_type:complete